MLTIFPGFNAHYYAYYFAGLAEGLGQPQVRFATAGFPALHPHALALILDNKRIYISAGDGTGLNQAALEWCDVYAKVNLDWGLVPDHHRRKVIPIGPSFGIRFWSLPQTLILAAVNYRRARKHIPQPREHFANYYRQYCHRLPLSAYTPGISEPNYIFYAASLWRKEPEANRLRANFMEAARSVPGITFEGGFAPGKQAEIRGFDHLLMQAKLTFPDYLQRTKASLVAFNTPAVQSCLGWKLGEFLALGKAIISTPLTRPMPAPLVHGEHIHYVDGSVDSIYQAIHQIQNDSSYRHSLEKAARSYWETWLSPTKVMARLDLGME